MMFGVHGGPQAIFEYLGYRWTILAGAARTGWAGWLSNFLARTRNYIAIYITNNKRSAAQYFGIDTDIANLF